MATIPATESEPEVDYPTGDGKPMAETPIHRDNMIAVIDVLKARYAADPTVYLSGNMLMYYVRGDKRKHVSPDVFMVRGIPPGERDAYFVWREGKGPDVVFEFTSASTRDEDLEKKFLLYRDTLGVREYFLFDPKEEYLDPPMQGYRLVEGGYEPIAPVAGRLPSAILGVHLERDGQLLRLFDPHAGRLLTSQEKWLAAEAARQQAEADRQRMAETLRQSERARREADAELERLRMELEALRHGRASP